MLIKALRTCRRKSVHGLHDATIPRTRERNGWTHLQAKAALLFALLGVHQQIMAPWTGRA